MRCPDCGGSNPSHARFCGDCGYRVGADGPQEHPAGQAPVATGGAGWDLVFKRIGIGLAGLFVLGLLAGF